MECNICRANEFREYKNRGSIQCAGCGSIERTRLLKMYLDKFITFRPGLRVLHIAPELQLFEAIAHVVGDTYHIRDISTKRYASLKLGAVSIQRLDLCEDCPSLPTDFYDLILHNHVIEHLPCNVTAVLWHLQRALKPDGLHMFSVPIFPGYYEEILSDMIPAEREKRLHHPQHYRKFGREDLLLTLGKIFDIEKQLGVYAIDLFGEEALRRYNIPPGRWRSFTGANPFMMRKSDLKLR